jgi:PKD repeat protein
MKNAKSIKYLFGVVLTALMVTILPSCEEEEATPPSYNPVAGFTYEVNEENVQEVSFTNTSVYATSYSWDFGDGATSVEENPTHVYDETGIHTVTLTATNDAGKSSEASRDVELTEVNVKLLFLAGEESKKWIIQREEVALGIYSPEGGIWWEFGGDDLAGRPCILDDEITFHNDGNVVADTKNTIWLDTEDNGGWNDDLGEGCHDEDEAGLWTAADGADVSDFANGGDYTFDLNTDTDVLTVSGSGFYIGLASKTNNGDNSKPIASKTYQITKMVDGDGVDSLELTLEIANNGGKWIFYLVSYDDFSMAPDVPMPPQAKPIESNDIYDDFSGEAGSSNIEWYLNEVTGLTHGVANPDGVETFLCGMYEKGTSATENIQTTLDYRIDFSTRNQFSIKAYFPSTNDYTTVDENPEDWATVSTLQKTIVLRFYDSTSGSPWESQAQIVYTVDDADLDSWVDISYDFSDIAESTIYDKVIIQIGGEGHHMPGTFYIANFQLDE